ncbi:MAG: D-alanyl-D-alanine carboxypeptidase [Alphaproteobacteria bacterium]|nr:D-alanyl-D-alanine carboxypeptidase [Alphaproteobacteria bacterium]
MINTAACSPVNAAMIVNANTGEIIYSYNADKKTQPASLTKMMTLMLTFKALKQKKIRADSVITISANAASQKPCILGLKVGQKITVRNAILALITKSANDIAVALAEYIGKTEQRFVRMMNQEARRLHMTSTTFVNPSGWKNPRQLTTVRDMAKLSRALINEYPAYYHLFATKQFSYNNKVMRNHNMLLGKRGSYLVDGIKTGFVTASGYNLAASATNGQTRLIAIVLGGKTRQLRDKQVDALLRRGFSKIISRKLLGKVRQRHNSIRDNIPTGGIYNKLQQLSKDTSHEGTGTLNNVG